MQDIDFSDKIEQIILNVGSKLPITEGSERTFLGILSEMLHTIDSYSFGDGDFNQALSSLHLDAEKVLPDDQAKNVRQLIKQHIDSTDEILNSFSSDEIDEAAMHAKMFAARADLTQDILKESHDLVPVSFCSNEFGFSEALAGFMIMNVDNAMENEVSQYLILSKVKALKDSINIGERPSIKEPIAFIPGQPVECSRAVWDIQDKIIRFSKAHPDIAGIKLSPSEPDSIDGSYDQNTQRSVMALQDHFGMEVTGIVDSEFYDRLTVELERVEEAELQLQQAAESANDDIYTLDVCSRHKTPPSNPVNISAGH